MKKVSLCLALCAAFSLAAVTAPSYAKGSKSAKVTVRKAPPAPPMVAAYHGCLASNIGIIPPLTVVGCTAFWAIPVALEALLTPHA
jgi:hypothetical protein